MVDPLLVAEDQQRGAVPRKERVTIMVPDLPGRIHHAKLAMVLLGICPPPLTSSEMWSQGHRGGTLCSLPAAAV